MELFFDSYEKNPFEEELEYRIEGASDMDAKAMYRLFVKNLVAFVYYETSCPFAFEFYSGYKQPLLHRILFMVDFLKVCF